METMTKDELKTRLSKEWLLGKESIQVGFHELAEILLKKVIIEKGERQYRITDIEFYLYTPKHRDIITYPRNCEAGQWFFHSSGVDISFESNVETLVEEKSRKRKAHLTEDCFFGGILIKGLQSLRGEDSVDGAITDLNGPQKACFELFDMFDAFGDASNFPKFSISNTERICIIKSAPRHNLLPKDKTAEMKVASILVNNYCGSDIGKDELVKDFNAYLGAKYRYHV